MTSANERIKNSYLRFYHQLEVLGDKELREIRSILRDTERDLNDRLERMGLGRTKASRWERERVVQIRKDVRDVMSLSQAAVQDDVERYLTDIGVLTADTTKDFFDRALPSGVGVTFDRLPMEHVIEIVNNPIGSMFYGDAMETAYEETVVIMDRILARGIAQGLGVDEISRMMRNAIGVTVSEKLMKKYGRDISRKTLAMYLDRIVRTETIRVSNAVALRSYRHNADIIKGVQYVATIDRRTCVQCASLDGRVWKLSEFNLYVPIHPRCFADSLVPILTTKGWKPVSSIQVGDKVLTHTGNIKRVTRLIRYEEQDVDLVTIKVVYPQFEGRNIKKTVKLTVTGDHPLWIEGEWIPANRVRIGDKVTYLSTFCRKCGKVIPHDRTYCSVVCRSRATREEMYRDPGFGFMELEVADVIYTVKRGMVRLYNFSVEEDESYVAKGFVTHNCRCLVVPLTKSWKELGLEGRELPPGTRSSLDGEVPETLTYAEWFKKQPASWQKKWLGPKRYEAFKAGELKITDFYDVRPLRKLALNKPLKIGKPMSSLKRE